MKVTKLQARLIATEYVEYDGLKPYISVIMEIGTQLLGFKHIGIPLDKLLNKEIANEQSDLNGQPGK